MRHNIIETVMGAVVLAVAGLFLVFAYTSADLGAVSGYAVQARFASVGGLSSGADVRISGVKVGTVTRQSLDAQTFQAVVEMQIDGTIRLPTDTTATIASDGLLGGKYLNLQPGGDEEMIAPGGRITYTQAAVSLEDLLGRFIFSAAEKSGEQTEKSGDAHP